MTPESIIRAAEAQGIEFLSITDHIHPFTDISIVDRMREEFSHVKTSISIRIGCEADVISVGETVVTQELIEKTDFITVSANHFQNHFISQPKSNAPGDVASHYLDMFSYAASLEYASVIAHPFFVVPNTYDPAAVASLTEKDLMPAIELAARNKIAVEISRRALTEGQTPFILSFYKLCKEAGLKFSIGSDAHRLQDVGKTYLVEPLVSELGLTDKDIWLP